MLPGTGRGTIARKRNGGGGSSLRKPSVYRARKLRRTMSLPEVMLWQQLRAKKLGFKVLRQHPIGSYVADFYVSDARLVIEIDGETHNCADAPAKDANRDRYLEDRGCGVMRVPAVEVLSDLGAVVQGIVERVRSPLHHAPHGPPPRPGEDLQ
ncbi:MAG: endonuclease domain-containing protein [Sphingomicrobium sp.]